MWPTLWVFGEKDVNVPTEKSVERLKKLQQEATKEITIKVFQDVGHTLLTWKDFPPDGGYVHGYLDLLGRWARKQIAEN